MLFSYKFPKWGCVYMLANFLETIKIHFVNACIRGLCLIMEIEVEVSWKLNLKISIKDLTLPLSTDISVQTIGIMKMIKVLLRWAKESKFSKKMCNNFYKVFLDFIIKSWYLVVNGEEGSYVQVPLYKSVGPARNL